MLSALNTPNGAWSLKDDRPFVYDNEVWIKGKMLSENGREGGGEVEDLIEINEVGHPRELYIRRRLQIRKKVIL